MDSGQVTYILSRLLLGALASFFAIILWSKTRDIAWMLIIISTITVYAEVICSILKMLGVLEWNFMYIGSVSIPEIALPAMRLVFLIAALLAMIVRHFRHK